MERDERMKIGFFISDFPRATETFIMSQLAGLRDRGHELLVMAPACPDDQVNHDALERHAAIWKRTPPLPRTRLGRTLKGLQLTALHGPRHPRVVARTLDPRRFGRHALSFAALNAAVPLLDAPHFDVVHCHFGPTGVMAAILKDLELLHAPLIVTFYGHDVIRYPRQHGADIYKRLFQRADRILALDEVMKERLEGLGAPEGKLRIQPLSVDCELFAPPHAHTDQPPLQLLSVGRLVEKKGFEDGLRAVARALECNEEITYRIAGDGPLLDRLKIVATELQLGTAVEFLGSIPHDQVRDLMRSSHALLAPSTEARDGDQEGTPTVIIEAMACGIPIIATRHAGIGSLVEDEANGWLVGEGDVDSLSERIARACDPDLSAHMGANARKVALERFEANIVIDKLESIYRDVMSG